jgi:Tellurite resistance protein and related permeases
MNLIKRIPLTIYGVMVALASLGNLLANYGDPIKYLCGVIAVFILISLILRLVLAFNDTKNDLQNPIVRSISPTFSMSIMILCTYLKPFATNAAYIIWIGAIVLYFITILYFIAKFVLHFNIKTVFPSWFAVSAGGVVASVTCGAFKAQLLGQVIFYLGFGASLILFPIVVYRMFKVKEVAEPARPTYYIFAAPFNLCLAGYISAFSPKLNMVMFYILFTLALITLIPCLISLPFLMKREFYPSYAGFAFTTAISGVGMKAANGVLSKAMGGPVPVMGIFVNFMELMALFAVSYAFIRYLVFIFSKPIPIKKNLKETV